MSYENYSLGDICSISTGKFDANHGGDEGLYEFYTCADKPRRANTFSFDGESIVLPGNGANVGLVLLVKGKFEAYQRTYVLQAKEESTYIPYVYFHLDHNWKRANEQTQFGSATNYVRMKNFTDYQLPLPPLETQKKIVKILDKAQSLIGQRKEQIKEMDSLIQSLFYDMFGDPVSNPMGWEVKKLGDITDKITDGTHKTPKYLGSGVTFLSAKNIKNTNLVFNDVKYISIEEHKELTRRCKPEFGDVLITKSGSTGSAAIVNTNLDFSIFESLALIKFSNDNLAPNFLKLYINSHGAKHQFAKMSKGGTIKHLHLNELRKVNIPIPPIELQNIFSERVKHIEQQKEYMTSSLKELEDNFNCLMQKAFKGELV
jgi:type I restriction enzyme S subunit